MKPKRKKKMVKIPDLTALLDEKYKYNSAESVLAAMIAELEVQFPELQFRLFRSVSSPELFDPVIDDELSAKMLHDILAFNSKSSSEETGMISTGSYQVYPVKLSGRGLVELVVIGNAEKTDSSFLESLLQPISKVFGIACSVEQEKEKRLLEQQANLISQINHDFNSIITLSKSEEIKGEELRGRLERSEKLLDDLLFYIRDIDLFKSELPVNELLNAILEERTVPDNVKLTRKFSEVENRILVDAELINKAIDSIMLNAYQALFLDGGCVSVSAQMVNCKGALCDHDWLHIGIRDDGPGVAHEFLPFLFNPFFTTARHQGRNGMGLCLARKIIRAHEGSIRLKSRQGAGTEVSIYLPDNRG